MSRKKIEFVFEGYLLISLFIIRVFIIKNGLKVYMPSYVIQLDSTI